MAKRRRRRSGHRNMLYEDPSRWGTVVAILAGVGVLALAIGMMVLWSDLQ